MNLRQNRISRSWYHSSGTCRLQKELRVLGHRLNKQDLKQELTRWSTITYKRG